jgi:uncharacterized protein YjbI with pentapeptide repeats
LSEEDTPEEPDHKDWSFTSHIGKDLRDVNLSGADLRRAVFDEADLEGANLSGADLRNASFLRANLMKCAFDGADMRGARFLKARMNMSNFQNTKLENADLRGIRGRYAIWRDANWWDARMDDELAKVLAKKWPKP